MQKTIILIGLMGAGKSSIGKKLAERLGVPFTDLDMEIENNQGVSITEIFAEKGETYFRELESRILERELKKPPHILATGGGVFIRKENRDLIKESGISIWLKADIEVLLSRVSKKKIRPLLEKGDKRKILEKLMEERYPVYAEAEFVVDSKDVPHNITIDKIVDVLTSRGIIP